MKISKGLVVLLVFLIISVFIGGCSKGTVESTESNLSDDERFVYESVIDKSKDFKSPSSVRVLRVGQIVESSGITLVELQGKNGFDAVTSSIFILSLEDGGTINKGEMVEAPTQIFSSDDENIDTGNINRAIKEYWEDKGIE